MVKRRAWVTPDTPAPETFRGRCFSVPDDIRLVGAVTGALLPLVDAANWEEDGTMTAEEAADIMSAAFEAFVSGDCGGDSPCVTPGTDGPIFRIGTNGHVEQLDNGEWVEPFGDYALPLPEPRTETTSDEKQCSAASNAANALKLLYEAMLDFYGENVDPQLGAIELYTQIGIIYGAAFGLVGQGVIAFADAFFQAFHASLDVITGDYWTDAFHQNLVCLLKDNSSVDGDGRVTFNFQAVLYDLVGFILPVLDGHLGARWQVWYLLQFIGAEGLNASGGAQAVSGDCVECGRWARKFNFTLGPAGWFPTVTESAWNSGGWWQSTSGSNRSIIDMSINPATNSAFTVQRVRIKGYVPSGALPLAADRTFSSSVQTHSKTIVMSTGNWEYDSAVDGDLAWDNLTTAALKVRLYATGTVQLWRIYEIVIWGTGSNVWAATQGEDYTGD